MKFLIILLWASFFLFCLVGSQAVFADSCMVETVFMGKSSKQCATNGSLPQASFEAICNIGKDKPVTGMQLNITFMPKCPSGHFGYCESKMPAGTIINYYYSEKSAQRTKKVCNASNPMGPGTWHDP
jgi:hypothetical protein